MHLTACLIASLVSSAALVVAQYSDYSQDIALYARESGYYDDFSLDARGCDIICDGNGNMCHCKRSPSELTRRDAIAITHAREPNYGNDLGLDVRAAESYEYDSDDLDLSLFRRGPHGKELRCSQQDIICDGVPGSTTYCRCPKQPSGLARRNPIAEAIEGDLVTNLLIRDSIDITCRGDRKVICDGPQQSPNYCRCTDPPPPQIPGMPGGIPIALKLPTRGLHERSAVAETNQENSDASLLARNYRLVQQCGNKKVVCDGGENPRCHCEDKTPPSRRSLALPPPPGLLPRSAFADAYGDDWDMSTLSRRHGLQLPCSGTADVECSPGECHCKNPEKWGGSAAPAPVPSYDPNKKLVPSSSNGPNLAESVQRQLAKNRGQGMQ
ncbi:hypothetical protein MMC10_003242 [Thelotrema lepadinum]|nr:hypothetical protein [Thelotrema lepadinum]